MKGAVTMDKRNFSNGQDIPLGLGMAMAQNPKAMEYFSKLDSNGKQRIINATHSIHSREQMHSFVDNMAHIPADHVADFPFDTNNGVFL